MLPALSTMAMASGPSELLAPFRTASTANCASLRPIESSLITARLPGWRWRATGRESPDGRSLNASGNCVEADLCERFVAVRRIAAHGDAADDLARDLDGQAALERGDHRVAPV